MRPYSASTPTEQTPALGYRPQLEKPSPDEYDAIPPSLRRRRLGTRPPAQPAEPSAERLRLRAGEITGTGITAGSPLCLDPDSGRGGGRAVPRGTRRGPRRRGRGGARGLRRGYGCRGGRQRHPGADRRRIRALSRADRTTTRGGEPPVDPLLNIKISFSAQAESSTPGEQSPGDASSSELLFSVAPPPAAATLSIIAEGAAISHADIDAALVAAGADAQEAAAMVQELIGSLYLPMSPS
eukprot:9192697-Pyramimonas_sp.AAC.2